MPCRSWFANYKECDGGQVFTGNDNAYNIVAIGTVHINMLNGKERTLTMVRHISDMKKNLVSLGALEVIGCKFTSVNG
ncbi:hypothetical protein PJI17_32705, partial [Mycobacterium kansasii]